MADGITDNILLLLLALFLVLLNAFFVAAEFSLVKIRASRLKTMVKTGRPFARTAEWLRQNLNNALSVCQLGITMASLGLGWIGEPAVAALLRPAFISVGISSEKAIHTTAFIVAFTVITAAHIIAGEQAPKIFAISRPGITLLVCSLPLKFFYIISFPFMWCLNQASNLLLRVLGMNVSSGGHESPASVEEIRSLLKGARAHGQLTARKHQLLEAAFAMDTRLTRQFMVPRVDVVFLTLDQSLDECLDTARRTGHTRFPLCKKSLDDVEGVVNVKDLIARKPDEAFSLAEIARPPRYVPETLPANALLREFQATRQHLALVLDEHGAVVGIVSLENALEELIGQVQDEFDKEEPELLPEGPGRFVATGSAPLDKISARLGIALSSPHVDTLSGLLFKHAGRVLKKGDAIDLGGVRAEVLEMQSSRARRIRLTVTPDDQGGKEPPSQRKPESGR